MNGSEIFISNGGYSRTRAAAILFWTLTTGYRPFGSSALDPKIRLGRDDFRGARTLACRVETRLDACRSLRRRQASTRVSRRQARVPAATLVVAPLLCAFARDNSLLMRASSLAGRGGSPAPRTRGK